MNDKIPDKQREISIDGQLYDVRFFDEKHTYTIDGEVAYGITGVLGRTIPKPALMNWGIKLACEAMDAGVEITEAKRAPRYAKESAGEIGTQAHKAIECILKGEEKPPMRGEAMQRVAAFTQWLDRTNPVVHEVEQIVCMPSTVPARQMDYDLTRATGAYIMPEDFPFKLPGMAGTLDLYLNIGVDHGPLDTKTGNSIWPEAWIQNLFYGLCLKLEGRQVDKIWILHLPPEANAKLHAMPFDECMQVHGAGLVSAMLGQCWHNDQRAFKARIDAIKGDAAKRAKLQARVPTGPVTKRGTGGIKGA